jgi:lysozyme family protein
MTTQIPKATILIVVLMIIGLVIVFFLTKNMSDKILAFIIRVNEGGSQIVNDPNDPGGLTKYGIAQKFHPGVDVKNLTLLQAVDIYKKKYLSKLPTILDPQMLYQVLDMAINAGVKTAINLYRPNMTVTEYQIAREKYYRSLKNFPLYGKSWLNRTYRTFK